MGITKRLNIGNIFLFLFLILFPLGQIIRIGIVHPIDIVVGLGALVAIIKNYKKPEVFKYFLAFLFVAAFSWVFSLVLFQRIEVFYGGLYLIRLAAYFYFFAYVVNFVKENKQNGQLLESSLLTLSVTSSVFGWIQYFSFSNIGPFTVWGWDDHFLRVVGTFLDPSYLGLIITFGILITIHNYLKSKNWKNLPLTVLLVVSLAFTYSRASYLAFFAGLFVLLLSFRKLKYFLVLLAGFLLLMFLLPTAKNHILFFTRSFSAINRIENYKETLNIFKASPVLGVGYDNLCLARSLKTGYLNFGSHACSGSDSSLLFVLATTGVVGLLAFVFAFWNTIKATKHHLLYIASLLALTVHSSFSNSVVYPWTLGYTLILLAIYLRSEGKS